MAISNNPTIQTFYRKGISPLPPRQRSWFWRNKEGAIIGGIVSLVALFLFGNQLEAIFEPLINVFPWFLQIFAGYLTILFSIVIFSLIGAFIDSIWRPNR